MRTVRPEGLTFRITQPCGLRVSHLGALQRLHKGQNIAVGLEGAAHFAAMARAHDLAFANAALFHLPSHELPRVLLELHASLKPDGVLFSSNRARP
jgi:hypothetical protein